MTSQFSFPRISSKKSRINFIAIVVLISLSSHISFSALDNETTDLIFTESAELNFIPYTSSYISLNEGKLFFGEAGALPLTVKKQNHGTEVLIPPKVKNYLSDVEDEKHPRPIIEKFELLRQKQLHRPAKKLTDYSSYLYQSKAEDWEGLCDQWGSASLEPIINQLIQSLVPISCNGITLEPTEIRELFTAFYDQIIDSNFYGHRTRVNNEFLLDLETELGIDDLSPNQFHDIIFDQLKKNHGIIVDWDHNSDVWNHPIFKAKAETQSLKQLADLAPSNILPIEALESDDPLVQRDLDRLQNTQNDLQEFTQTLLSKENRKFSVESFFKFIPYLQNISEHRQNEMRKKLDAFIADKKRFFEKNSSLHLNNRFKINVVTMQIFWRQESEFNRGGLDAQENSDLEANHEYQYINLTKNGKFVKSLWLTPARERVDFLWVPPQQIKDRQSFLTYSENMNDLVTLIERCQPTKELTLFYRNLDEIVKKESLSEDERTKFLTQWQNLKNQVDWNYIKNETSRLNSPISISDFQ